MALCQEFDVLAGVALGGSNKADGIMTVLVDVPDPQDGGQMLGLA